MDIVILKTVDDIIENKKVIFETLLQQRAFYPTADMDFYLTRIACSEAILNPYCILLLKKTALSAILLGYIENKKEAIQLGLGYRRFLSVKARTLHIVAGGCFLNLNTSELNLFFGYLQTILKNDFDIIQIDSFGLTYALIKSYKKRYFKNIVIHRNTQCLVNVSESYDSFYKNRSKNTHPRDERIFLL